MVLKSDLHTYEVSQALAKGLRANFYLCREVNTERRLILMIAQDLELNPYLERVTYSLGRLKDYSDAYEEEYAKQQCAEGATEIKLLHYDWLFPQVFDSFCSIEQDGRKILILDYPDADLLGGMPLMQIRKKNLRVDLKTSAWIMGRFLKLLSFLQGSNAWIQVGIDDYFLIPDQHRLLKLDFSDLLILADCSPGRRAIEIRQAAKIILNLIGVTWDAKYWKYEYELEDEKDKQYLNILAWLYYHTPSHSFSAYESFYCVVNEIWGRKFHPFTVLQK